MNTEISFISEHDGEAERKYKDDLIPIFIQSRLPIRAYLTLGMYPGKPHPHIILCLKTKDDKNISLVKKCAGLFKSLFNQSQHLDVMFITDDQEKCIRNYCCPFYTSDHFNVTDPDFFLFSSEGYDLDAHPTKCFKHKRLYGGHHDGYMLCDIEPSIIGQKFGLGDKNISKLVIANRLEDSTLFPISEWPLSIYVMRLIKDSSLIGSTILPADVELIAWAELYKKMEDIQIR